jgi:hypothetical protein
VLSPLFPGLAIALGGTPFTFRTYHPNPALIFFASNPASAEYDIPLNEKVEFVAKELVVLPLPIVKLIVFA